MYVHVHRRVFGRGAYKHTVREQLPHRFRLPRLLRRRLQRHNLRIRWIGIRSRVLVRTVLVFLLFSLERQRMSFRLQRKLLGTLWWPTRHLSVQHDFQDWSCLEPRKWRVVVRHCGYGHTSFRGFAVSYRNRAILDTGKSSIRTYEESGKTGLIDWLEFGSIR